MRNSSIKSVILSIATIALCSSATHAASAYKQDTGTIKTFYTTAGGTIAIQLSNGFPNSYGDGQCATASINGYGGNVTADPLLKSALLSAKAAQQNITVTVVGCDSGNPNWFKITDVYIN